MVVSTVVLVLLQRLPDRRIRRRVLGPWCEPAGLSSAGRPLPAGHAAALCA